MIEFFSAAQNTTSEILYCLELVQISLSSIAPNRRAIEKPEKARKAKQKSNKKAIESLNFVAYHAGYVGWELTRIPLALLTQAQYDLLY